MDKFLEFKDVSYFYQTKKSEVQALKDVNFTIEEKEFASLVGPSGCGKTTPQLPANRRLPEKLCRSAYHKIIS